MLLKDVYTITNPLYEELYSSMEEQLNNLEQTEGGVIEKIKHSIDIVRISLDGLRRLIGEDSFKNEKEEIEFFKKIKPKFFSHLIYLLKILKIETKRPIGSIVTEEEYLQKELLKLTCYFDNNLEFYQYYRTGSTYLDEIYFLRTKQDIYFYLDESYFSADPSFSTSHDLKVSKILANELVRIYLHQAIEKLHGKEESLSLHEGKTSTLQWTGSKTALIELLYALQSSGVFNNATADVKQIATYFQKIFNVELGNYYRTFQEIRIRKKTRTQFLEQLTEKLIHRMDETDENPR